MYSQNLRKAFQSNDSGGEGSTALRISLKRLNKNCAVNTLLFYLSKACLGLG